MWEEVWVDGIDPKRIGVGARSIVELDQRTGGLIGDWDEVSEDQLICWHVVAYLDDEATVILTLGLQVVLATHVLLVLVQQGNVREGEKGLPVSRTCASGDSDHHFEGGLLSSQLQSYAQLTHRRMETQEL